MAAGIRWKPSSFRPASSRSPKSATRRSCSRSSSPRVSQAAADRRRHLRRDARQPRARRRGRRVADAHARRPHVLRWVLGVSFLAMAVWTLIPDKLDDDDATQARALRRVRHHARRVLPRRDGRQDADRHRRARGAISTRSSRSCRHDARHDDRQRAGGADRRSHRASHADAAGAHGRRGDIRDPGRRDAHGRRRRPRVFSGMPRRGRAALVSGPSRRVPTPICRDGAA